LIVRAAQATADRQAIFARHHEIEHEQVEPLAQPEFVHGRGVFRHQHGEALFPEIAAQQIAQAGIVGDEENLLTRILHGANGNDKKRGSRRG
ncbi:hypothetical protein RVY79_19640, partial [Chromohalobacter sp. HP20-39]